MKNQRREKRQSLAVIFAVASQIKGGRQGECGRLQSQRSESRRDRKQRNKQPTSG